MNWEQMAIDDLKKHKAREGSLENMITRIKALKEQMTALKGRATDMAVVRGGVSRMEDKLLDNIVERERLKATYKATKHLVDIVERGLSGLDEKEKFILLTFYMDRPKKHVERCMEQLHLEQAQVYRMKDRALYKFTISMYGIVDY